MKCCSKKGFLFTLLVFIVLVFIVFLAYIMVKNVEEKERTRAEEFKIKTLLSISRSLSKEEINEMARTANTRALYCFNKYVYYNGYITDEDGDGNIVDDEVKDKIEEIIVRGIADPERPVENCMGGADLETIVSKIESSVGIVGFSADVDVENLQVEQQDPWSIKFEYDMVISIRDSSPEPKMSLHRRVHVSNRIPITGLVDPVTALESRSKTQHTGMDRFIKQIYYPKRILVYTNARENDAGLNAESFNNDLVRILGEQGYTVTVMDRYDASGNLKIDAKLTDSLLANFSQLWVISSRDCSGCKLDEDDPLGEMERAAVRKFHKRGNGIALFSYGHPQDAKVFANSILEALGMMRSDGYAEFVDGEVDRKDGINLTESDISYSTSSPIFYNVDRISGGKKEAKIEIALSNPKAARILWDERTGKQGNVVVVVDEDTAGEIIGGRVLLDSSFTRLRDADVVATASGAYDDGGITDYETAQYAVNIADYLANSPQRPPEGYVMLLTEKHGGDGLRIRGKGWFYGNWTEIFDEYANILVTDNPKHVLEVLSNPSDANYEKYVKFGAFIITVEPSIDVGRSDPGTYDDTGTPGTDSSCNYLGGTFDDGMGNTCDYEVYAEDPNGPGGCFDCLRWSKGCSVGGVTHCELKPEVWANRIDRPFIVFPEFSDYKDKLETYRHGILIDTHTWKNADNIDMDDVRAGDDDNPDSPSNAYWRIYDIEGMRELSVCLFYERNNSAPSFLKRHTVQWDETGSTDLDENGIQSFVVFSREDTNRWDYTRVDYLFWRGEGENLVNTGGDPNEDPDNPSQPPNPPWLGDNNAVPGEYVIKGMPGCKYSAMCTCPLLSPLRLFRLSGDDVERFGIVQSVDHDNDASTPPIDINIACRDYVKNKGRPDEKTYKAGAACVDDDFKAANCP
ncbi:MAG: hypothetical protein QXP42_00720 [Candidatus Micrarchaeia archaeon]